MADDVGDAVLAAPPGHPGPPGHAAPSTIAAEAADDAVVLDVEVSAAGEQTAHRWEHLPDLVLVHLFGFLGRKERVAAGLVCTRWLATLHAPALWRNMRVVLCSPTGEERLAAALLRRYGVHVRSLELRWARPVRGAAAMTRTPQPANGGGTATGGGSVAANGAAGDRLTSSSCQISQRTAIEPALALLAQLEALRGELQLSRLSLVDWVFSYKWAAQRSRLLAAVANFLGSQRRLEVLTVQNACLGVAEVPRLLAAAARGSAAHLQDLRLAAAFREWQAPHTSPRFLRALRRLAPLRSLRLDYPALSDATLRLLADSCAGVLQHLAVTVRDTDYRQHSLSDDAWASLAAACPRLQVSLNVENMAHYDDLCGFLLPSMPLSSFRLYSGPVWDQSRSRDFRATIRLLINYYSSTLENIHLHIKNNREQLDDLLLELLARCHRLVTFHYDGVLRHMDTVRDICHLRLESAINFQTIHVRPRNLNKVNRTILKDITRDYEETLAARTVDFKIEDPSPVIPFS